MYFQKREGFIESKGTKSHFTKCNNAKCNHYYPVSRNEEPDELGFLCPLCRDKVERYHVIQCSSCKTVINFVAASKTEEKVVFNISKCSHCYGSVDDEYEIEPLYYGDSYI
ncbi:MAG: hypothetical protein IAE91_12550 [Ignavibacteriaceae bacterium]|nr:hypothetical protein [Ignavibacteriaceae bacterium]